MDSKSTAKTHVGLGYAARADAFQSGREAAQMAIGQLPSGPPQLTLVIGPSSVRFKDFVEGVRLVAGEETLVGVPVERVISPEFSSPDTFAVLVLQSSSMRFSLAGSELDGTVVPAVGSLFSQFRQTRGNARGSYEFHGTMVFECDGEPAIEALAHEVATDAGLESWLLGSTGSAESAGALVCGGHAFHRGIVGVECLSNQPWGVGTVGIGSFLSEKDIYREAVKSAMRSARQQLAGAPAALGFILFDFPLANMDENDVLDILESAISIAPSTPLIGIPTRQQFSRGLNRSLMTQRQSVISVLVPQ